jgi:hypothetical protein
MSNHAATRCSQRGIRIAVARAIADLGDSTWKPGGAFELRIKRRDKDRIVSQLKEIASLIERSNGKAILCSEDGNIITVYHRFHSRN